MQDNFQATDIAPALRGPGNEAEDAEEYDDPAPDDVLSEIEELEEIELEPLLTPPSAVTQDDTALVHRTQQGDMAAFEALFHKYQGAIYRTAYAITHDAGASEEVLQDCFYKTYLNIMKITGEGSLSPWLHRVAVNLSCNALKKRRVWLEPLESVADYFFAETHHSPENLAERAELQGTMRDVINTLSLKHRIVVTLHYLQDFSLPEIAYILDLPVGTVKSRLHHARKELRNKLEAQYPVPREAAYDPAH
jgi:RNA polymerase sigma-70 factor (ECF subfamily)